MYFYTMTELQSSAPQSFEDRVSEYLSKNKVCLYILTPHYGGMCHVTYMRSLMKTQDRLRELGVDLHIEFCNNDSLVSRARNNLVARAMSNTNMTHMLFIDNDITWDPDSILKLLLAEKPVVGGIYPLKHYNWEKLVNTNPETPNENVIQNWIDRKNQSMFKDAIPDVDLIHHRLLSYNLNLATNTMHIENNLTKVRHIATGFMMIKRKVIEKLQQAFPSTKYVDDVGFLQPEENKHAYALFDCGVEEGHYFSEDWLFCHRWTKMGGEIHVEVTINLNHTGPVDYRGCYLASII
jgi:acyl-CoA synthetase (AMP-forming)/AMP-acid ligase II